MPSMSRAFILLVFLSCKYAAATGTPAGEGEYCGEGAGGECAEGLFCNFDNGSGGFCESCSGCPSCDDCGLPLEGAASCTSMCVGTAACGDAMMSAGEECDDGNLADGDGCSSACKVECGFACWTSPEEPSVCMPSPEAPACGEVDQSGSGSMSYGEVDQSGSGSMSHGDFNQNGYGSGSALGSSPGPPGSNAGALRCYAGDGTDIIQVIANFHSASDLLA